MRTRVFRQLPPQRHPSRSLTRKPPATVFEFGRVFFTLIVLLEVGSAAVHPGKRCPGNVEILELRKVQRSLILARVSVNHNGPYEFVVDTGTQVTTLAPAVANDLDLHTEGDTSVIGIGEASASFAHVDLLQLGSHAVKGLLVTVQNLDYLQTFDPHIGGVLGGNFLAQFDVLIDYSHDILCLDSDRIMQHELKGKPETLLSRSGRVEGVGFPTPPVVEANFLNRPSRGVHFLLDSGTNAPLVRRSQVGPLLKVTSTSGIGIDGREHRVDLSSPQDILVGAKTLSNISFVILSTSDSERQSQDFDGLLPTVLFRSVFISYKSGYALLDPM